MTDNQFLKAFGPLKIETDKALLFDKLLMDEIPAMDIPMTLAYPQEHVYHFRGVHNWRCSVKVGSKFWNQCVVPYLTHRLEKEGGA